MNNLTTEQKARIFAIYIRQTCCNIKGLSTPQKICGVNSSCTDIKPDTWDYNNKPPRSWEFDELNLILRPLKSITNEDAIEVARLNEDFYSVYIEPEDLLRDEMDEHSFLVYQRCFVDRDDRIEYVFSDCLKSDQFQYLIQRGYAVPLFIAPGHPDNGKTAIELGLAIDSTVTPLPNPSPHSNSTFSALTSCTAVRTWRICWTSPIRRCGAAFTRSKSAA